MGTQWAARSATHYGNHVRFFWTERGVKSAVTLHNFGEGTTEVLGALVADLRPAHCAMTRHSDLVVSLRDGCSSAHHNPDFVPAPQCR